MKLRQKRGITLIALIITIIVLLILAGVTISMVVGDNGVLTQAQNAKIKTEKADLEEALGRAVASAEGEYATSPEFNNGSETFYEWLKGDSSRLKENGYTITLKSKSDGLQGTITKEDKNNGLKFTLKGGEARLDVDVEITGEFNANKEIEEAKTFLSQVTVDNYGDYVNYDVDIDGNKDNNDWQIFYKDEENVYLIADDYITADKIPNLNEEKYSNGICIDKKIAKYFRCVDSSMQFKSYMYLVPYLLDSSDEVWGNFKNEYAEYAIGGPTLEIFCNSWNERHDDNKIKCEVDNYHTYYGQELLCYDWSMEGVLPWREWNVVADADDLYWKKDMSNASVMFLASGSSDLGEPWSVGCEHGDNGELEFYLESYGSWPGEYETEDGYRPLICLSQNVCAENVGGVWILGRD